MGAHERYTLDKGPHQDVDVVHAENHPDYVENSGTDIAILYLASDVSFTGKFAFFYA